MVGSLLTEIQVTNQRVECEAPCIKIMHYLVSRSKNEEATRDVATKSPSPFVIDP